MANIWPDSQPTPPPVKPSNAPRGDNLPVSAIIVVSTRSLLDEACDEASLADPPVNPRTAKPIASLKILGQSILQRTIDRLHSAGVRAISVVSEGGVDQSFMLGALLKQASKGFKKVLLIRLGAYVEVDYVELLKFHYEAGATVTRICDADGPLDFWVLNPTPVLGREINLDTPAEVGGDQPLLYLTTGYVNRLEDARSLQRLAEDSLLGRCAMRPRGEEIERGVWVDVGARIHRSATILAPAYIGRGTRVRASASVNRFSAIEECCLVDHGAVIEHSSILPDTYIGKGIAVAHAVVDGNRLMHLRSDISVTIDDAKIIGRAPSGWHSFRYGDKKTELLQPAPKVVGLEPVAYKPPPQRPALRIFSKGEV